MIDEQGMHDRLAGMCASVFQGGIELHDLTHITTGWETDIYAFTLKHGPTRERSEPLIVRLYAGEDAPEKAEREYAIMHALHTAGYPVPHVWLLDTSRMSLGAPFVLMERIDGPVLLEAFLAADESRRRELLARFCETLAGLHALDWHIAQPILTASWADATDGPNAPYAFIDAELVGFRRTLERFPVAQPLSPALDWLEAHRDDVPCRRLAITHGDYHPNNVLLRHTGSPVVIDWGAVAIADPRRDLAWTLLLTSTSGYAGLYEPIVRGYERAAHIAVEQLGYFEVMAACRRLFDMLVSLSAGADALGMRPEAVALMRQQGSHLRQVYEWLQERTDGIAIPAVEDLVHELG